MNHSEDYRQMRAEDDDDKLTRDALQELSMSREETGRADDPASLAEL